MATRVCVIFGTESGGSERHAKRISKTWTEGIAFSQTSDFMSGDAAAKKGLEALASDYDFLVVVTSSYGDGDPPSNYTKFLTALYVAEGEPLKGCQHAVLGFGSTDYETFQNCPRLTDKLLGGLGSRRALQRVEVDENDTLAGDTALEKWSKDVVAAFAKAASTKGSADVCAWTKPESEIFDKKSELVSNGGGGGAFAMAPLVALAAVGVGFFYWKMTSE